MEANKINEAPVEAAETATGKSRMSKGQMVGMVVLTIVALAGVAFGVWGMVGKDQAEKNLAIKITEAGGKITEMVTDKITSVSDDGTVTEITDTVTNATQAVNSEDYIYIGEWGIKIKKPENWRDLIEEYAFYNDYPHATDTFEIEERSDSDLAHVSISNGVGYSCDYWAQTPDACFEVDGDNIVINFGPNTSDVMRTYFANPENYSKI